MSIFSFFLFLLELSEEGILDDLWMVNKLITTADISAQFQTVPVPVMFKCTRRIEQVRWVGRFTPNEFTDKFLCLSGGMLIGIIFCSILFGWNEKLQSLALYGINNPFCFTYLQNLFWCYRVKLTYSHLAVQIYISYLAVNACTVEIKPDAQQQKVI